MASAKWLPLTLDEGIALFGDAPFRWWVAGGHALELHLGMSWRSHGDFDIGICRAEADRVFEWLPGWDLVVASENELRKWDGRSLDRRGENNVWARRPGSEPWALDITVGDGTDESWIYRRDRSITRSWDAAVLHSDSGIPYLAPDIQLLFKSKDCRRKDGQDARRMIPELKPSELEFLVRHLPPKHQWRRLVKSGRR